MAALENRLRKLERSLSVDGGTWELYITNDGGAVAAQWYRNGLPVDRGPEPAQVQGVDIEFKAE